MVRLPQQRLKTVLAIAIMIAATTSTYSPETNAATPKLSKLELGIGFAALRLPDYPGADQSTNYALPLPLIVYRGEKIQASRRGISGRLYSSDTAEVDFGLAGSLPVNSTNNQARREMEDLDITGEFGPRIKLRVYQQGNDDLWLHLPIRAMASTDFRSIRYQGWKFAPSLRYIKRLQNSTFITAKLETGIAGSGFNDYFYGVKNSEVIVGERQAYQGKSGYSGSRIGFAVSRWWDDWRAFAGLSFINIDGSAYEDSPLVRQNSGVTFRAGFTWTFFRSEALAPEVLDAEI